ncbi:hypothetical protein VTK56DRAFT_9168 [Thermocarpiscus australiensis]
MSSDSGSPTSNSNDTARHQRRGSITSSAFTSLFRNNSIAQAPAAPFPTPLATTTLNDQRRRLSVTTLGLSGTSPTTPSTFLRRTSVSTNSNDSIDENAIEEDEGGTRTAPVTPFIRRMSIGASQAMRVPRGPSSPGSNDQQGFNWSEQLRSRAENTVAAGARPSFSLASGLSASPPRTGPPPAPVSPRHERAKSVSDMPSPPAQAPRARQPQKPDPFQERILKGDFYMD